MITVENLCKTHSQEAAPALDGVDLEVRAGTICGVVGPEGAGKTTLLRCLAGLDPVDSGNITVAGKPLPLRRGQRPGARSVVGFVPDGGALLNERTVAGNVARPFELAGLDRVWRQARVIELLDLVGLGEESNDSMFQLSLERRRRVEIAQVLAAGSPVLVIDEIDEALRSESGSALATVLDRVRGERGLTVVLASNDAEVIRRLCDDVVVLDRGRVLERGPVLDLLARQRSWTANVLLNSGAGSGLPPHSCGAVPLRASHFVEVVLIGHAAVGSLLPMAVSRFDIGMTYVGGGVISVAGTLVGRFLVGISGERAPQALDWLAAQGCSVWTVEDPTVAA